MDKQKHPTDKQPLLTDDGDLMSPDNVVPTSYAAQTIFRNLRDSHSKRRYNYERIQGMVDGNPPYNRQSMIDAGLSHMANVNWKDGEAFITNTALAYWSLLHHVSLIADIRVTYGGNATENDYWSTVISEEWDKAVKSWEGFVYKMNVHQNELVKFGLSPVIWKDERDWRFDVVDVRHFFIPDQTRDVPDELSLVCIQSDYTAQFLWKMYLADDKYWSKEAIAEVLYREATINHKDYGSAEEALAEIQSKIRNGDAWYSEYYTDDISLVSVFAKEYDGKISSILIHPDYDTSDFLFFYDRQYDSMDDVLMYFTYQPGQKTVHGNKGVGQSIITLIEAITQLDCSVFDQAKQAGCLILKSSPTLGRSDNRAMRFVHGSVIDVGEAEIQQNTLGSSVGTTVEVAKYFRQKALANNNIAGNDPGVPDRQQNVAEIAMQATNEARIQKNKINHHYRQIDKLFREMFKKMLKCKKSYPGYEYVENFKEACIRRGVPEELFDYKNAEKDINGFPKHFSIKASRSSGSGSQFADQLEVQALGAIMPQLKQRGLIAYLKKYVSAFIGPEFVDVFFPPEDLQEQPTHEENTASIENNLFSLGKQTTMSPDQAHDIHAKKHMEFTVEVIKAFQENPQGMDEDNNTTMLQWADKILRVIVPHFLQHLILLEKNPARQALAKQLRGEFGAVVNMADMISNNASNQRRGELEQLQKQQEEMRRQQEQNTPEHIRARGEVEAKIKKVEAQIAIDRQREQYRFMTAGKKLRNDAELKAREQSMKLAKESEELLRQRRLGEETQSRRNTEIG